MTITKSDLKILRYIYRHRKSVRRDALLKKFSNDRISQLLGVKYISCDKKFITSQSGYALQTIPPDAIVTLTDLGVSEVESRQWFDLQYFVTHILLPVVIGVLSSVITTVLTRVL